LQDQTLLYWADYHTVVGLTDYFSSKQEAVEWIEAMKEEVAERKEG
jgi:hypothetical protein